MDGEGGGDGEAQSGCAMCSRIRLNGNSRSNCGVEHCESK